MKAVFLDRDGVINVDNAYIHRWEDFEFLPGALDAMRRLTRGEYALIIVTNQSGIARGYFTQAQYDELTSRFRASLEQSGVAVTDIYHCPHHPQGTIEHLSIDCVCRKPAPGMLLQAMRDHNLNMGQSLLIGDKVSDLQAARAARVGLAYLVASDEKASNLPEDLADGVFKSLATCTDYLLAGF